MSHADRRKFLKMSGGALIGLTFSGVALRANAQEKVSPSDADAKALEYAEKSPVEGSTCSNCMYIDGAEGDAYLLACRPQRAIARCSKPPGISHIQHTRTKPGR